MKKLLARLAFLSVAVCAAFLSTADAWGLMQMGQQVQDTAGRQAGNWGVVGSSGAGKSFYVKGLVKEYMKRVPYGVIFAPSPEMSELVGRAEYAGLTEQSKNYSPEALYKLYKAHGWLHFETPPTKHTRDFVHQVLEPIWKFGKMGTTQCEFVIVYIEAKNYLVKNRMPGNSERAESEGRKFGFDIIKDFQKWTSPGRDAPDWSALSQVTRRVVFPTDDVNARDNILSAMPQMRDPFNMERPDRKRGLGGEMDIYDSLEGVKAEVHRRADGSRWVQVMQKRKGRT
jgi:hypothetical protein